LRLTLLIDFRKVWNEVQPRARKPGIDNSITVFFTQ